MLKAVGGEHYLEVVSVHADGGGSDEVFMGAGHGADCT